MKNPLYDHGFGHKWNDIHIHENKGYYTSVADFHEHDFYEINIIISGNVKILLSDRSEECEGSCIVLTAPETPHFVSMKNETLYNRLYLLFSREFVEHSVSEWGTLSQIFGKNGNIIKTTPDKIDMCKMIINRINIENNTFRKRLLILYLLSCLSEFSKEKASNDPYTETPPYIIDALEYINKNFGSKITASLLAKELHIGRTTLMTSFKKFTGSTLLDYITHKRISEAIKLLCEGHSEQETAYLCSFGDVGSLIRAFKNKTGITPKQYLIKNNLSKKY